MYLFLLWGDDKLDQSEIREFLRLGIEAAENNNFIIARDYLRSVIDADPTNETAWLWMARVSDTVDDRLRCLRRVLQLNPHNQNAQMALEALEDSMPPSEEEEMGFRSPLMTQRTTTREGFEEDRDWFQPVSRQQMPGEMWSGVRREGPNLVPMLIVAGIGIMVLALAVILLLDYVDTDEDETPTPTSGVLQITQTAEAVALASIPPTITSTPRPTSVFLLTPTVELPPTLPPTATPTETQLPTNTPTPNPPELYSVLFSGNTGSEGDPYRLFVVDGDGANFDSVSITLPPLPGTSDPPSPASVELSSPDYSPDGTFIVFTGQVGNIQELYIVATFGGEARQLTALQAERTTDAAWSPDGEEIVFTSDAEGSLDLYIVPVDDSSAPTRLTTNIFDNHQPTWSPDGQYIAYTSDKGQPGDSEIFVMPRQGNVEECPMTNGTGSSFSPHWSPDGATIVFISNRGGDNDLYIMRSDGSAETLLSISDGDWQERDPAWSPDGEWIIVSSTRVAGDDDAPASSSSTLWLVSPNGREWLSIATSTDNNLDATWVLGGDVTAPEDVDFSFRCAIN